MMMVVSREDAAAPRALTICAPITTANRGSAYEVELPSRPFLRERSYANIKGLQAIQHHELQGPIGIFHGKVPARNRLCVEETGRGLSQRQCHQAGVVPGCNASRWHAIAEGALLMERGLRACRGASALRMSAPHFPASVPVPAFPTALTRHKTSRQSKFAPVRMDS